MIDSLSEVAALQNKAKKFFEFSGWLRDDLREWKEGKKRAPSSAILLLFSDAVLRANSPERGLDFAWRREVLKTCIRALLSVPVTSREGFNGNRRQQNSLSTMEHGKVEIGAEILLRIGRKFGRVFEWLLTR